MKSRRVCLDIPYRLRLAQDIQEYILSMPKTTKRPMVTEQSLRPIVGIEDRKEQLRRFWPLVWP